MNFISQIRDSFKNLSLDNIINVGIGLAIIAIFKIFSSTLAYILIKMFHLKTRDKKKIKNNGFYKPLKTFFVLRGIYIAIIVFQLPDNIFNIVTRIFKICIIILAANGFANLCDSNSDTFTKIRNKFNFNGNDTTINFFSKILKGLIYIVASFIVISELGYDLSGLAAGLGIGSVVIALAAQDIAKSFIAGLSIIADRPFEIGDYIEVDTFAGTVEDITFRTTRIRDINNQIVVLPNSFISTASITNASKREKRRYSSVLTLELDTPIDKVQSFKDEIKLLLTNNDNILPDNIRIYFDTISMNGIDLSISFYTNIINYDDFLQFKENINYILLNTLSKYNISLAYDSKSIYLKKD